MTIRENGTSWVKSNVGTIVSILVLAVGFAAERARSDEVLKAVTKSVAEQAAAIKALEDKYQAHVQNTTLHIDDRRDERRWTELLQRMDRMERGVTGRR